MGKILTIKTDTIIKLILWD